MIGFGSYTEARHYAGQVSSTGTCNISEGTTCTCNITVFLTRATERLALQDMVSS